MQQVSISGLCVWIQVWNFLQQVSILHIAYIAYCIYLSLYIFISGLCVWIQVWNFLRPLSQWYLVWLILASPEMKTQISYHWYQFQKGFLTVVVIRLQFTSIYEIMLTCESTNNHRVSFIDWNICIKCICEMNNIKFEDVQEYVRNVYEDTSQGRWTKDVIWGKETEVVKFRWSCDVILLSSKYKIVCFIQVLKGALLSGRCCSYLTL